MEKTNREIRALLSSMAPARAAQAVRLVGLPPDEEAAVLAVDVHGQSSAYRRRRCSTSAWTALPRSGALPTQK